MFHLYRLPFSIGFISLGFILIASFSANADTVVANYRHDFQLGTFPAGWSYLWNEFGDITDPANYSPLETDGSIWDTDASNPGLPDPAPGARCHLSATGGRPGSGFPDRYAVAAFQVTEDGPYAITNSFLTMTFGAGSDDGLVIQVRVSGVEQDKILRIVPSLATTSFDGYLGGLSNGDFIYVCFGENGNHNGDAFDFDFSIEKLDQPLGELNYPVNGDPLVGFTPNFLWEEGPFGGLSMVDEFQIQVSKDELFTQIVTDDTTELARYVPADRRLEMGATHYWRVRCLDKGVAGAWSEVSEFAVADFEQFVVTVDSSDSVQDVIDAFDLAKANAPATVRLLEDVTWHEDSRDELLPLTNGYDHIWFDGNDKEITITNPSNMLFQPVQSDNLILSDFSVDYNPLPYVLCEVVELDPVNNRFTVKTISNSANPCLEIDNPLMLGAQKQHMFIRSKTEPGKGRHGATGTFLHPNRQEYDSSYTGGDNIRYHVIQFVAFHTTSELEIGEYMIRFARYDGRNIVRAVNCRDVCLNNVRVYASPSQFFASIGGTRSVIVNCSVALRPGRFMSTNADCVYVRRNEIGPWVEDCQFTANTDDCMNFHTVGSRILEKIDTHTLRLEVLGEIRAYSPGDSVAIWDGHPGTDLPVYTTVASTDEASLTMTLADPVGAIQFDDDDSEKNSLIYNLSKANDRFVVKNNAVTNGKRYGLMVPSQNGIVVNNAFVGGRSSGLMIATRPSEGFGGTNVVVRGNLFEDLGHRKDYFEEGRGVITVDSLGQGWRHTPQRFNSDIQIIDNRIVGWNAAAFYVRSCFNVLIAGNEVTSGAMTTFSPEASSNHLVVVGNSDRVAFTDNILFDSRPGSDSFDDEGDNTNLLLEPFHTAASLFGDAVSEGGLGGAAATATATPFNDGVANLLKYAFNMDLSGADATLHTYASGTRGLPSILAEPAGPDTHVLRFEFVRRVRSGLSYTAQKSDSLMPLSWDEVGSTPVVEAIDENWERVVIKEPFNPATTPHFFGRVEVSLP